MEESKTSVFTDAPQAPDPDSERLLDPPHNNDLATDTLNSLQSKEQCDLLNEIDKLRGHGVSEFVSLPQLGDYPPGELYSSGT